MTLPASEGALAGSYTTAFAYLDSGDLLGVGLPAVGNLPAEDVLTYYDAAGMPQSSGGENVYVANTRHTSTGEVEAMVLGNTRMFVVTNDWDPGTRRLNGISLDQEGVSGTDLAARFSYDAAGNVKAIDNRPTRSGAPARDTQCFTYDGLGRLTSAWTPSSASCGTAKSVAGLGGPARYWTDYTYDPVGNRTSATEHTAAGDQEASYSYPAAGGARPHAVTKVTEGSAVSSFGYDASGNTITRSLPGQAAQTLTWDVEGELGKVTQSGKSAASFVYTADGERLIRKQDGATTVYLPGGQELTLTAAGVKKATRYYSWAGQTVAVRTGAGFDDVSTLVNDHHGTASLSVTNVSAKVTRRYQSPFGESRGTAPTGWSGDHGFLDKPADTTGLTAIGARYYDPAIGRFVSVDPVMDLADPQQWHGYAYAHSSPVTFSDPTGLREVAGDGRHDTREQIKSAVNHTKKGGGWHPVTSASSAQEAKESVDEVGQLKDPLDDVIDKADEEAKKRERASSPYDPPEKKFAYYMWDVFVNDYRHASVLWSSIGTVAGFAYYCEENDCFEDGWNFYRDSKFWVTMAQTGNEQMWSWIGTIQGAGLGAVAGGTLTIETGPGAAVGAAVGGVGGGLIGGYAGGEYGAYSSDIIGKYARRQGWL